jgi:hypothetical protein
MMTEELAMKETTHCETCGAPTTSLGTKRCNRCWNVERNLADYLKTPGGQAAAHQFLPVLDDWVEGEPDAWDYEAVLRDNNVTVEWSDTVVDGDGKEYHEPEFAGWGLGWKNGGVFIGQTTEQIARKAAALFVSLWLRSVSASFADKLMDGFICFLERQESTSLTFLAEFEENLDRAGHSLRLSREGFCTRTDFRQASKAILQTLNPQSGEEIIVTFAKRNKA